MGGSIPVITGTLTEPVRQGSQPALKTSSKLASIVRVAVAPQNLRRTLIRRRAFDTRAQEHLIALLQRGKATVHSGHI